MALLALAGIGLVDLFFKFADFLFERGQNRVEIDPALFGERFCFGLEDPVGQVFELALQLFFGIVEHLQFFIGALRLLLKLGGQA